MNIRRLIMLVFALGLVQTALAGPAAATVKQGKERPRIGLVLSGGGTKGGAHIGVLEVLEKYRVPVDVIVGTSIGAVMGGFYAAGMDTAGIRALLRDVQFEQLLQDSVPREKVPFRRKREDHDDLVNFKPGIGAQGFKLPLALNQGQQVTQFLRRGLRDVESITSFDQLPTPFRAVSADLLSGEMVVPDGGDLPLLIRASMTLPAILAPVPYGNQLLVDGGVVNNLPVDIARKMGADIVIAVNITSPYLKANQIKTLLSVTDQMINLMTTRNVHVSMQMLGADDILIEPAAAGLDGFDYEAIVRTIEVGIAAAEAMAPELHKLSVSPSEYAAYVAARQSEGELSGVVREVVVSTDSDIAPAIIRERLGIERGTEIDRAQLEAGIDRVFGLELFDRVDYRTERLDDGLRLNVDARRRSRGPNYLQFGARYEEDFSSDSAFNFSAAYLQTEVNKFGGEWLAQLDLGATQGVSLDFYQPMTNSHSWFINPRVDYERTRVRVYNDAGDAIGEYRVQGAGAEFWMGANFGDSLQLELGWERLFGSADVTVGQFPDGGGDFDKGEWLIRTRYDSLDRVNLPNSGVSADLTALWSRDRAGAGTPYEQIFGSWLSAWQYSRYRLLLNVEAGATPDNDAPPQSQFLLGGFGRLSGYPSERFRGQNFALMHLNASRRFGSGWPTTMVLGYSLEGGQVWDEHTDKFLPSAAIFAGVDTPAGPVYLAGGFGAGGESTIYLRLGSPFGQQRYRPFD